MPAPVSLSQGPPAVAWTPLNDYDGSGNLVYAGLALSIQPNASAITVTSVSAANPAVVSATAHGLQTGNVVTISGGTGDWAGLNGQLPVTVINANSFSVAVNSTAYTGTFAGTITTCAPRSSQAVWAIQRFDYTGSNQTHGAWCNGNTSASNVWDNRTTLSYQ